MACQGFYLLFPSAILLLPSATWESGLFFPVVDVVKASHENGNGSLLQLCWA